MFGNSIHEEGKTFFQVCYECEQEYYAALESLDNDYCAAIERIDPGIGPMDIPLAMLSKITAKAAKEYGINGYTLHEAVLNRIY